MITKIISGGQSGADQAGLFAASTLGIETGGWAPKGWKTELGRAVWLEQYGLIEHQSSEYPPRTEMNIRGSDGTIIFGTINSPGSRLTWDLCSRFKKSCMHLEVPFTFIKRVEYFRDWIMRNNIKVLNVAGNRESVNPGICEAVTSFLMEALIEVSHG